MTIDKLLYNHRKINTRTFTSYRFLTMDKYLRQIGTKEPLDEGERREWKVWLQTQYSKKKDHGIRSAQVHGWWVGKKWKQWQILFPWAPKSLWTVTATRKLRCLLLQRKAITNLDSVLKSRDINLLTNVHTVKAMAFSRWSFPDGTVVKNPPAKAGGDTRDIG